MEEKQILTKTLIPMLFFLFSFLLPTRDEKLTSLSKYKKNPKPKQNKQCLLDAMLQAKDAESGLSMTDGQLRDELLTMLIAG